MSVDKALRKLKEHGKISEEQYTYLNAARIIRNKIGHRYKQPSLEDIINSINSNNKIRNDFYKFIESYL